MKFLLSSVFVFALFWVVPIVSAQELSGQVAGKYGCKSNRHQTCLSAQESDILNSKHRAVTRQMKEVIERLPDRLEAFKNSQNMPIEAAPEGLVDIDRVILIHDAGAWAESMGGSGAYDVVNHAGFFLGGWFYLNLNHPFWPDEKDALVNTFAGWIVAYHEFLHGKIQDHAQIYFFTVKYCQYELGNVRVKWGMQQAGYTSELLAYLDGLAKKMYVQMQKEVQAAQAGVVAAIK